MTDHDIDGETNASNSNVSEASLVPDSTGMVLHGVKDSAEKPAGDHKVDTVRLPKDIVLQRLTPNSSWEDFVFSDTEREKTFEAEPARASEAPARRNLSIAAVVAIAASVGAIGGALATVGVGHFLKDDQKQVAVATATTVAAEQNRTFESAIAKINADLSSLKSGNSGSSAQAGKLADRLEKLTDRIDRVEKAQAEPAAKLAKLSDAVDKLRASEATASVPLAPAPAPAVQPNRLPVVDGWVLRQVLDGAATVEGRQGIFEVIPGDPLPGVGRVDAIRRQDGRWVVVTSRGLIVTR